MISIPEKFNMNISQQLFYYKTTLIQKQVLNVRFKDFWYLD